VHSQGNVMKKIKSFAGLFLIGCLCSVASRTAFAAATYAQAAKVISVRVDSSGFALVGFTGQQGTPPACVGASYPGFYYFNPTTDVGKAFLAVLLNARSYGYLVNIYGSGTCTTSGTAEDLSSITD